MELARTMVAGCDVWLNNPAALEASGTSGQKCGSHGCLNLSIMDGWWRRVRRPQRLRHRSRLESASIAEQDRLDAENLYCALTDDVIPAFYDRTLRACLDAGSV